MRSLVAAALFSAVAAVVAVAEPRESVAQDKKTEKKAQPKVDPKTFIPDADTLKTIKDKTEELRKAIAALKEKKLADDVLIEVEIYLKAAENIVRFEEWLAANSVKWALTTLDQGLVRAKQAAAEGKAVWRDAPGKWVLRAYRSQVDNSIQPYAVLLPPDYGADPKKKWRLDVVLHGRDGSLTEAKFIATHNGNAPKDLGYIQVEVYGRGNNAYRWAGETDVLGAIGNFRNWASTTRFVAPDYQERDEWVDENRIVLRGFSMGGAGTWHLGLHDPGKYCVIGPGAGFTTTHGYIGNLPKELPDYQEKCLRIYDAVDYAENAFNVPVVAYSGEKDAQKKAADNIENALKGFKEPLKFTHLVAPGLEHQMPKEWQDKAEVEYRKFTEKGRDPQPERIRFVTYTPEYGSCKWLEIIALEKTYDKAVVDATLKGTTFTITTANVRWLALSPEFEETAKRRFDFTINGQAIKVESGGKRPVFHLVLDKGKWVWAWEKDGTFSKSSAATFMKRSGRQGPIDVAFMESFRVVMPTKAGWSLGTDKHAHATVEQFAALWDRYFRGTLPVISAEKYEADRERHASGKSLVLFGDPQSNPLIAKVLPKLPITWTKEKLVVNGAEYDPKTHVPVLIYPNPLNNNEGYVVINSGHTFKEADLKGTNALLYPRLGDWAVIKPAPTDKDPAAYEVIAAGLFDENWQFPKKK